MAKVLLAGESWIHAVTDYKGFDPFPHTQIEIGCERLLDVLEEAGHEVTHLRSHDVAQQFPQTMEELDQYDVVVLSDIGANSMLLSPDVFMKGQTRPNRLKLLREWVEQGGGLMMAGGYLSFQGFQAKANYAGTAIEEALPVTIHRYDDRIEAPEGLSAKLTSVDHPITAGMDTEWPMLLGYQSLTPKEGALVLATIDGDPLLVVGERGQGRAVAYASDISPHWAPNAFMNWPGYQQLFDGCLRWLAKQDD